MTLVAAELSSNIQGYLLTHTLTKNLDVQILLSQPVDEKFLILIRTANVARDIHLISQNETVIDHVVINHSIEPFLEAVFGLTKSSSKENALVMNSKSLTKGLKFIEKVVAKNSCEIVDLRLGKGIAGQSLAIVTGPRDDLEELQASSSEVEVVILNNTSQEFQRFL